MTPENRRLLEAALSDFPLQVTIKQSLDLRRILFVFPKNLDTLEFISTLLQSARDLEQDRALLVENNVSAQLIDDTIDRSLRVVARIVTAPGPGWFGKNPEDVEYLTREQLYHIAKKAAEVNLGRVFKCGAGAEHAPPLHLADFTAIRAQFGNPDKSETLAHRMATQIAAREGILNSVDRGLPS